MSVKEFIPEIGTACLYREGLGVNWFLCKVIAFYEDKVWLHNLSVGSMPVKHTKRIAFMKLDNETATLLSK